jgi:hypothetical protein
MIGRSGQQLLDDGKSFGVIFIGLTGELVPYRAAIGSRPDATTKYWPTGALSLLLALSYQAIVAVNVSHREPACRKMTTLVMSPAKRPV